MKLYSIGLLAVLGGLVCGCGEAPQPAAQTPLAEQVKTEPVPVSEPAQARKTEAPAAPAPKKDLDYTNILLITVDTLRADHMGCYGYAKSTSPRLDVIAKEGAVFEHAIAPKGSTWPSLATILTGLYPVTHGVRYNGMKLDSNVDTLAETLAPAGYTSAVFIANGGRQSWEGFETKIVLKDEPRDRGVTDEAIKWLDSNADKKFFLWVHYFAPHGPYEPLKDFDTFTDPKYNGKIDGSYDALTRVFVKQDELADADLAHVKGLYDGEVSFTDYESGRLLDKVASFGILDDTLVVFSADHGEELGDHHRYFHHQASLYEGVLRVPLLVRLPGKVPAGVRYSPPVSLTDIAPTIVDLVGQPIPAAHQGVSLVPAFAQATGAEGATPAEPFVRGPVFGEWGDKMLFVRTAEYKYIYNPSGFQPPVKRERDEAGEEQVRKNDHTLPMKNSELYRLTDDPLENQELSATLPDVVKELEATLKAGYQDKYGWKLENTAEEKLEKDLDDETRKELEALGYVL